MGIENKQLAVIESVASGSKVHWYVLVDLGCCWNIVIPVCLC